MGELVFTINSDGTVEIEANGYSGNECLEASRPYEKELGVVTDRKRKPEALSGEGVKTNNGRNRLKY